MGTPLGPKYIPYTHMDPLAECFSKSWPTPRHGGRKEELQRRGVPQNYVSVVGWVPLLHE